MPVFTSTTSVSRHGVFAIERTPPSVIRPIGTGVSGIVGAFPWGPMQTLAEPATLTDARNMFAPAGMDRTTSAYLTLIAKAWGGLRLVRVVGVGAVKATRTLSDVVPTVIVTLTAKYEGTEGNSITAEVLAASDGDSNHFNLKVKRTGASGTTEDLVQNLNYSGVGADSAPDLSKLLLLGAIVKNAAGRPLNGTSTFSGGTSPAILSTDYVGTAGSPDKGMSLFENDKTIRRILTDDPGNTIRAAVNAGVVAHVALMGDRVGFINGNSGLTAAATRTDAALYRSARIVYCDPWVRIYDDTTGAKQLVPPNSFGASLHSQLSPSTPIAWKNSEAQAFLFGIVELEAQRGEAAGTNTDQGVSTIIREEEGGHTFEAAVTTIAPVDPAKRNLTRTSMGDYIATSFVRSTRGSVDAPNVPLNNDDLVLALNTFMGNLKRNQNIDPNHLPHVRDYAIPALSTVNTQSSIDEGNLFIPLDVKISSAQERIFLSIRFGESVTIQNVA